MMLFVVLALAQATLGSPLYTPEVASAKASHLLDHSLVSSGASSVPAAIPSTQVSYKTLAPLPVITPAGYLADAPEVAAAKAAHFAAHAKAGDYSWTSQIDNPYKASPAIAGGSYIAALPESAITQHARHAGAAFIPYSGLIPGSPDLALAKAVHNAQHANTLGLASPTLHSGFIADSPELALAKAVHFAEHVNAAGLPAHLPPSGVIPDSPEVALARAAHHDEHIKASAIANAIVDDYHLASHISSLGFIPESPETTVARSAHLAANSAATAAALQPI